MTWGAEEERAAGSSAGDPTVPEPAVDPAGDHTSGGGVEGDGALLSIEASPWDVWDQPIGRKPLRRLPQIAWSAVRFVWAADRRSLLLTAVNDVAAGLLSGVQVLVVAVLLSRLLSDDDPASAARATAPWIAAYAGLSAAAGVFGAVVRGRADLFEERVGQASTLRLMTVASDVDLLAFESPRFYDRLQRVQSQSQFRPTQVVHSLSQLASGVAGSVGVLIALAVIQPILVPIALLWFLPLLAATHRNVDQLQLRPGPEPAGTPPRLYRQPAHRPWLGQGGPGVRAPPLPARPVPEPVAGPGTGAAHRHPLKDPHDRRSRGDHRRPHGDRQRHPHLAVRPR